MNPIKVMIVDDEKLSIEDLSSIVDWEDLGYEIVTTAYNGKQGLIKFQQFHPDVVFSDIRMPIMDGLEMIQKIREMDGRVKLYLLTAYEDFGYAKCAIQNGVSDYIIKSDIRTETLSKLLRDLHDRITMENTEKNIVLNRQISDFFTAGIEHQNALFTQEYYYLLIEQDMPIVQLSDEQVEKILVPQVRLTKTLTTCSNREWNVLAAGSMSRKKLILVMQPSVKVIHERYSLLQYAAEIKQQIGEAYQKPFTCYLISTKMNLHLLKRLYAEQPKWFQKKYFYGCDNLWELPDFSQPLANTKPQCSVAELENELEQLNLSGVTQCIQSILMHSKDLYTLRQSFDSLYKKLNAEINQLNNPAFTFDLSVDDNWRNWLDVQHAIQWFTLQYSMLIRYRQNMIQQKFSKPIVRAMEYMQIHFKDSELTVQEIANHVHLSVGHLSLLFKKETGKTVKNYLTEIRIAAAKQMLADGEQKVYEIALSVGYQTSQYFSQVFYKHVGYYPMEYARVAHGSHADTKIKE